MPSDSGSGRERSADTEDVTPLAVWMREKRVKGSELARRTRLHEQTISRIRSGRNRPTDEQKLVIAEVTLEIERELKVAEPRGVTVIDWFESLRSATSAQAVG